ncbi:RNA pseudouridylate synthase domain containing protein 2 [Sparganum proliferum]
MSKAQLNSPIVIPTNCQPSTGAASRISHPPLPPICPPTQLSETAVAAASDSETVNTRGDAVTDTEDGAPPAKAARLEAAAATTGVRYYSSDMADAEQRALLEAAYDRDCPDCNRRFADPQLGNLVLRLHAFRYSGSNWSFTAPLPAWATAVASEAGELAGRDLNAVIEELLPLL